MNTAEIGRYLQVEHATSTSGSPNRNLKRVDLLPRVDYYSPEQALDERFKSPNFTLSISATRYEERGDEPVNPVPRGSQTVCVCSLLAVAFSRVSPTINAHSGCRTLPTAASGVAIPVAVSVSVRLRPAAVFAVPVVSRRVAMSLPARSCVFGGQIELHVALVVGFVAVLGVGHDVLILKVVIHRRQDPFGFVLVIVVGVGVEDVLGAPVRVVVDPIGAVLVETERQDLPPTAVRELEVAVLTLDEVVAEFRRSGAAAFLGGQHGVPVWESVAVVLAAPVVLAGLVPVGDHPAAATEVDTAYCVGARRP